MGSLTSMDLFPWKRYWYSEQSDLLLDSGEFLPDPETHWGALMHPNLLPLDSITSGCVVLLGEPGLGKSVVVQRHVAALQSRPDPFVSVLLFDLKNFGSETSLSRNLFDSAEMIAWAKGSGILELYLDSLDEGLTTVETLAGFLVQELGKIDRTRLRLRLVCRPAVWPESLKGELEHLWPQEVSVHRLAPLREIDVTLAAEGNGVTGKEFVTAVESSSAVSFARKPLTLRMLLQAYKDEGTLPASITNLYQLGILALATESNLSRQEKLKVGRLTAKRRVGICERIAAATIFCNRRVIRTQFQGLLPGEAEILGQDLYGVEYFESEPIEVNAHVLREILDTALFRWRQAGQATWDHQSHAEYLAAAYCARHHIALDNLKRLVMTSVDGQTRVAPQLKETAAWLSIMVPEFRHYLLRTDPLVLLRSDITRLSISDRKLLVAEALDLAEEEIWAMNTAVGQLGTLLHPTLSDQLQPHLSDRTKSTHARCFAMDIVRDCRLDLDSELLAIVSDATEPSHLRGHAAFVLAQLGQDSTKETLCTLLDLPGDDNDEIKGWCLTAVWPDRLPPRDLFAHLRGPKNQQLVGAYKYFLHRLANSLPNELPGDVIPRALEWVNTQGDPRFADALSQVQDAVILAAWNHLEGNDGITLQFASLIADRIVAFDHIFRGSESDPHKMSFSGLTAADALRRRLLIREVLREISARGVDPSDLFRSRDRLIYDEDIAWLIAERLTAPPGESEAMLKSLSSAPRTKAVLDAISAAVHEGKLPREFLSWLYVEFNSPEQKNQRSAWAYHLWYEQRGGRRRNRIVRPTPKERIEHNLQQIEAGKTELWPELARNMTLTETSTHYGDGNKPLTELPGWHDADASTRERIIKSARSFLLASEIQPKEFIGTETFPGSVIASYDALSLLSDLDSGFLKTQDATFWQKWLPLLLWYPFDSHHQCDSALIAIACPRAQEHVLESAMMMTKTDQHSMSRCIAKLDSVWNQDLEDALAVAVARDGLGTDWTKGAIEPLLSRHNECIIQFLTDAASGAAENEESIDLAIYAAARLMRYVPQHIWPTIWSRLTENEAYGRKLIEALAQGGNQKFFSLLSESQLTLLFIWTARHYPISEDLAHSGVYSPTLRDEVADFRNAIPRYLASIGTLAAITGLAHARKSIAAADWLKYYEANARVNAHRHAWRPSEIKDILGLASQHSGTMLSSPNRWIDFFIVLLTALAPNLVLPGFFSFQEKAGVCATLSLFSLFLFQLPTRRRSFWFPLISISFLSALTVELVYFAAWRR